MADESRQPEKPELIELASDFLGEDRHEFVAKLAYKLWAQRGRPFGSPEVDWFAAEKAVYDSLAASGLISPAQSTPVHIAEQIYT